MQPSHTHSHAGYGWRPHSQWWQADISPELRAWLLDPASLTRRVQQVCAGRFSLKVVRQGWARPQLSEAQALRLHAGRLALIREVQLLCDGRPWVFARTVIPRRTLHGRTRHLVQLGETPLGAVLFADPRMRRDTVEVARIDKDTELYQHALRGLRQRPAEIWGRRSVFWLGKKSLLVSEIFLPGLGQCPPGR